MSASKTKNTKQIILNSAIHIFAQKGYAGTSVQEIVKTTKFSKPSLYYYFQSKAGLFRAILDFAYDECFRLMNDAVDQKVKFEEKLSALVMAMFSFSEKNQNLMRLIFSTVFAAPEEIPKNSVNLKKRNRNFDLIFHFMKEGQRQKLIDPSYGTLELAHGLLGAASHRMRTQLIQPQGSLTYKEAQKVVHLFLNGAWSKGRKKV